MKIDLQASISNTETPCCLVVSCDTGCFYPRPWIIAWRWSTFIVTDCTRLLPWMNVGDMDMSHPNHRLCIACVLHRVFYTSTLSTLQGLSQHPKELRHVESCPAANAASLFPTMSSPVPASRSNATNLSMCAICNIRAAACKDDGLG